MAVKLSLLIVTAGIAAVLDGCASRSPPAPVAERQTASILASSTPSAGATVRQSVDTIKLRFDPPARLDEIKVTGPAGEMPVMVHSVGEVRDYSIPLSGLDPGAYTVVWRATAQGHEYRGAFTFAVRE
jgi:methionine-rich copper-binding protein CopC